MDPLPPHASPPQDSATALADSDLCVRAHSEILCLLEQLRDGAVPMHLLSPSGPVIEAVVSTVDRTESALRFTVDPEHPGLQALIESDEATAVAYLDSIKLQFEMQNLMLVRGENDSALHCAFPCEIFRFQRRNSFRVQPLGRALPKALLRHPMIPDMQLSLRVLDISLSGCALFLPADVPPLEPGVRHNDVRFVLDMGTRFTAGVHIHHVTALNQETQGMRLGCEVLDLGADAQRALQRYVDQNQKQRRLRGG